MNSTIVSVRIPQSLVKEVKDISTRDHFLDMSEAVRSIVRKKWLEWKDPGTYQIKQLRGDIQEAIKEKTRKSKQDMLLDELQRIKDMLTEEEVKE